MKTLSAPIALFHTKQRGTRLTRDFGTCGSDIVGEHHDVIDTYKKVLEQLDEPFPKPFVLQDAIDRTMPTTPVPPPQAEPGSTPPLTAPAPEIGRAHV